MPREQFSCYLYRCQCLSDDSRFQGQTHDSPLILFKQKETFPILQLVERQISKRDGWPCRNIDPKQICCCLYLMEKLHNPQKKQSNGETVIICAYHGAR